MHTTHFIIKIFDDISKRMDFVGIRWKRGGSYSSHTSSQQSWSEFKGGQRFRKVKGRLTLLTLKGFSEVIYLLFRFYCPKPNMFFALIYLFNSVLHLWWVSVFNIILIVACTWIDENTNRQYKCTKVQLKLIHLNCTTTKAFESKAKNDLRRTLTL